MIHNLANKSENIYFHWYTRTAETRPSSTHQHKKPAYNAISVLNTAWCQTWRPVHIRTMQNSYMSDTLLYGTASR